ncbi:hypothetical protein [Aestuariivirga sp.]|uniref:hypothetical protein n=1 Tax=Aestuariivirga sp. TaxID=2650926 RepID=UPI0035B0C83A
MIKRIGILAFATLAVGFAIEMGGQALAPGKLGIVSPAEAIVGMPLTPVSVAGVARRTARRCAVGVYYC